MSDLLEILQTNLVSKVYEHFLRNCIREVHEFLTLSQRSTNIWWSIKVAWFINYWSARIDCVFHECWLMGVRFCFFTEKFAEWLEARLSLLYLWLFQFKLQYSAANLNICRITWFDLQWLLDYLQSAKLRIVVFKDELVDVRAVENSGMLLANALVVYY